MYKQFAKYYDSIYGRKDYKTESEILRNLIKKYKKSRGKDLLDAACGTGNHIQFLKKYFNVTGLDLDRDMLKIARKKLPDVKFFRGDMRSFNFSKKFDVIVCLFSAIAHVKTYVGLEKTFKNFFRHLKPGGVVIVEPFEHRKHFLVNQSHAAFVNKPELKLARVCVAKRKGNIAILNFHFLVADKTRISYFVDRQDLGMFETKIVLKVMKRIGLKAESLKSGIMKHRELYIGIKK
jgi:ubiquinone/menaquinone biosynthesis C-methylase UbiE